MVCSQISYDNINMHVFLCGGDDSSIGNFTFSLQKKYLHSINWEWDLIPNGHNIFQQEIGTFSQ